MRFRFPAEGELALSLSFPSSVQESVEKLRKSALISRLLMLAEYGICVMVMNPERVRSFEDHSPKKLMLSEEIIAEKSGGETSSRDGVYEVFVYPFPKIGHYVSVTRTGHRVGAASKREGWGGGYTSPSGCLPYLPPLSGICTMRVS